MVFAHCRLISSSVKLPTILSTPGSEVDQMKCKSQTIHDYVLVGGGLQNGLLALALIHHQPHARFVILEAGETLGGNHTWCFHDGDISPQARPWFEPVVEHRWDGYTIRYPDFQRDLDLPYGCIGSARFHQEVHRRIQGHTNGGHVDYPAVIASPHDLGSLSGAQEGT